jgi:hypothetical protein
MFAIPSSRMVSFPRRTKCTNNHKKQSITKYCEFSSRVYTKSRSVLTLISQGTKTNNLP